MSVFIISISIHYYLYFTFLILFFCIFNHIFTLLHVIIIPNSALNFQAWNALKTSSTSETDFQITLFLTLCSLTF